MWRADQGVHSWSVEVVTVTAHRTSEDRYRREREACSAELAIETAHLERYNADPFVKVKYLGGAIAGGCEGPVDLVTCEPLRRACYRLPGLEMLDRLLGSDS